MYNEVNRVHNLGTIFQNIISLRWLKFENRKIAKTGEYLKLPCINSSEISPFKIDFCLHFDGIPRLVAIQTYAG